MQELASSESYLTYALLMVAQAWRANNNNTKAASKVQRLYVSNVQCILLLDNQQDGVQSVAKQAKQLAALIPPDDISEIEKCYFYAEQMYHITKNRPRTIKHGF